MIRAASGAPALLVPLVLQEAEESIGSRVDAVREAVWGRNDSLADDERWVMVDVFAEYVIVRQGRQLLQVPYTFGEDGALSWGEPLPVEMEYRAVRVESSEGGEVQLREAVDGAERGMEWEIEIIRPGHSKNGFYYPAATLAAAAPLFEGAHVFFFLDDGRGHKKNPLEKAPQHLVGWISGVAVREDGVVVGTLHFLRDGVAAGLRAQLGGRVGSREERSDGRVDGRAWPRPHGCGRGAGRADRGSNPERAERGGGVVPRRGRANHKARRVRDGR